MSTEDSGTDLRIQAVAKAEWAQADGHPWRGWEGPRERNIWHDSAVVIIAAADAADRAAGWVRVRVDDAAVKRLALAQLGAEPGIMEGYDPASVWLALTFETQSDRLREARAVLAALLEDQ